MQAADWNDYQAFLAVARTGQMARAAAHMGVDATTIGRRVRRLEERVRATLFEQTREGQVLTEAGEAMLAEVEAMEQAASRIAEYASGAGPAGQLRISASEGFGTWFLARHLRHFTEAYPAVTVDLVASSGFLNLTKREADIAIMLSRPRAGPLIASKLSDYALGLYASPAYIEAEGLPREAHQLSNHRLVGYIPDLLYAPELRYLDELHPGLVPTVRSSSINAQHQLISAGSGLGVLPCFIGDIGPSLVRVMPLFQIVRTFWLVTHRDNHMLSRIKAAKEWILQTTELNRATLIPRNP